MFLQRLRGGGDGPKETATNEKFSLFFSTALTIEYLTADCTGASIRCGGGAGGTNGPAVLHAKIFVGGTPTVRFSSIPPNITTFWLLFLLMKNVVNNRIRSRIRFHWSGERIRGSGLGSVPKCHGSTTLIKCTTTLVTSDYSLL
jgi:hypothetical protein